ncbi:hypothetical protein QL285_067287 [Trifolium repens]|nr:hypothetical protein QL285_067287 [Trifolium repens]
MVALLKLFSFSPFWICFADLFFPVHSGRRLNLSPASAVFCLLLFLVVTCRKIQICFRFGRVLGGVLAANLRCCWWGWRWRSRRLVLTPVVILVRFQIGAAFVGPGIGF